MSAERTAEELRAEIARLREAARYALWKRANAAPFGSNFVIEANNLEAEADELSRKLRTLEAERGER